MKLNEFLKEKRYESGLTQRELAKKVNMTQGQIAYVERGAYKPSLTNMLKLAEVLNINLNVLKNLEWED